MESSVCATQDTHVKYTLIYPDSKVHGANVGPIMDRQDSGGPHVGPKNFAIWLVLIVLWNFETMLNISGAEYQEIVFSTAADTLVYNVVGYTYGIPAVVIKYNKTLVILSLFKKRDT